MPNFKILDFLRKKIKGFIFANGQKEKVLRDSISQMQKILSFLGFIFAKLPKTCQIAKTCLPKISPVKIILVSQE